MVSSSWVLSHQKQLVLLMTLLKTYSMSSYMTECHGKNCLFHHEYQTLYSLQEINKQLSVSKEYFCSSKEVNFIDDILAIGEEIFKLLACWYKYVESTRKEYKE